MDRFGAVELIEGVFGEGKFIREGRAEYPCVRRLRHRRLITFLWLQGLEAPTELITPETFFNVMELRQLVEWGQWSDAVDHLSRFLPPPDTVRPPLSLSVEAAVLHRFLVVHMALADLVAGATFSDHVATLCREYFSRDSAVCQGTIRLRSILRSVIRNIFHTRHQDRASLDWECVRRRAAEIVDDLAYRTPELRQLALMPGGPMGPHNVLPIWSGFRRRSHVKKQACGRRPRASALAKFYLQKRSSLPSLSQEPPDELRTKTLNWVADILDESLRAGKHHENPLQTSGKEGSSCNPISQITFGTSTDHATNSVASSLRGKDAASSLILRNMFGGLAGPATNPGMSSVANAGELASHVPSAGAPFLGTTGAPVSKTEFGSLISHFENSEVTLMANADAPYNPIPGAPYRPLSKSMFGTSTDHATNSVTSSARGAGATASPVSQTAFGSFTGPTINPGRPSVASAGKLSSNVPTPGTPFLGTRGAPVSQSLFGSLSSHCGNSRVASMANAGAIVAPVSQTMFGTLTDPAKTLGMPSVANAGTSASYTLTPGAPYSVTDDPVLLSAIDCISSTPENSGVRLMTNAGAHVAAVTQTTNLASHSQNSGITEHLDQEGSNSESGFNPKKNPREELTTSDEQDLHPKRQRTTGIFGKPSLAVET